MGLRTNSAATWLTLLFACGGGEGGVSTSGDADGTGSGPTSTIGATTSGVSPSTTGSTDASAGPGSVSEGGSDSESGGVQPPTAPAAFYGVPWTGDGIGELRIQGEDFFWVSIVMPYDGEVDRIRQYLIGVGDCSYGCGDGGNIELRIHRDDEGTPGEEAAATTLTAEQVASVRNNDDVFFPVTFDPVTVSAGERIWMVASNHHADPTQNYISLDPFNLHARWADPELPGPVSSVDSEDRHLTIYDASLQLLRHKHHILAAYYTDDRIAGHGYVMCSPHCSHNGTADKWASIGADSRVRQRFTPDRDLAFASVDVRLQLVQGTAPLEVTIRQGGRVVATGSAADWTAGGWGYPTGDVDPHGYTADFDAVVNAQWGSVSLPRTTLVQGIEAEIELSAASGTQYRAVGHEYGSDHLPGAFHTWPEAEKLSSGAWIGWDERENINTGHLNFFFRLTQP